MKNHVADQIKKKKELDNKCFKFKNEGGKEGVATTSLFGNT